MKYATTIEWGDCDSAGIVFYPNYFRWFDSSFQHLLRKKGLDQRTLSARFGIVGTAVANAGAKFLRPATYGDAIEIDSHISEWQSKFFTVSHTVLRGETILARGHEVRFWAVKDAQTGKLSAGKINLEFVDLMGG